MQNCLFIVKETLRSFQKNIYTNVLLMLQFTICFFLLIVMMTFYFEIGDSEQFNTVQKVDDRKWYMLRMELDAGLTQFSELANAPDGLVSLSNLYDELSSDDSFDLISLRDGQCIYLDAEFLDERFSDEMIHKFIDNSDGEFSYDQCYNQIKDGDSLFQGVRIKSVQMNERAFAVFGLETIKGEGLTCNNTTLDTATDAIPIVLGYDYLDYFKVGEEIRIYLPTVGTESAYFIARIIGFLKEGSMVPGYGGEASGTINLDTMIICANGLHLEILPDTQEEKAKFASAIYADALVYSYISPKEDASYGNVVRKVQRLAERYNIDLFFTSTSFGTEILLKESEQSVKILSILTVTMCIFTFFCLVSSCINRVQKNLRTYAIYLMNGSGLSNIIFPFFWEFLLLLLPALFVNYWILKPKILETDNYLPVVTLLLMLFVVLLSTILFIYIILGGTDIEGMMRRKDE